MVMYLLMYYVFIKVLRIRL